MGSFQDGVFSRWGLFKMESSRWGFIEDSFYKRNGGLLFEMGCFQHELRLLLQTTRPGTKVVLKIVSCPPTVQVSVNRPDTKYQLGFSVQNGMVSVN